ncbi:hypothetical protein SK128_008357 [Halocaridina rubra]|uniref:Ig-like domain-containing protein n=1 Tax=Halocaridina rubra TaxID=373956 RepID=A0AAN8ZVN1_HALRR
MKKNDRFNTHAHTHTRASAHTHTHTHTHTHLVKLGLKVAKRRALTFDTKKLESDSQLWWGHHQDFLTPTYQNTPQNVTAVVGDSAFLPCTVSHLGDRSKCLKWSVGE